MDCVVGIPRREGQIPARVAAIAVGVDRLAGGVPHQIAHGVVRAAVVDLQRVRPRAAVEIVVGNVRNRRLVGQRVVAAARRDLQPLDAGHGDTVLGLSFAGIVVEGDVVRRRRPVGVQRVVAAVAVVSPRALHDQQVVGSAAVDADVLDVAVVGVGRVGIAVVAVFADPRFKRSGLGEGAVDRVVGVARRKSQVPARVAAVAVGVDGVAGGVPHQVAHGFVRPAIVDLQRVRARAAVEIVVGGVQHRRLVGQRVVAAARCDQQPLDAGHGDAVLDFGRVVVEGDVVRRSRPVGVQRVVAVVAIVAGSGALDDQQVVIFPAVDADVLDVAVVGVGRVGIAVVAVFADPRFKRGGLGKSAVDRVVGIARREGQVPARVAAVAVSVDGVAAGVPHQVAHGVVRPAVVDFQRVRARAAVHRVITAARTDGVIACASAELVIGVDSRVAEDVVAAARRDQQPLDARNGIAVDGLGLGRVAVKGDAFGRRRPVGVQRVVAAVTVVGSLALHDQQVVVAPAIDADVLDVVVVGVGRVVTAVVLVVADPRFKRGGLGEGVVDRVVGIPCRESQVPPRLAAVAVGVDRVAAGVPHQVAHRAVRAAVVDVQRVRPRAAVHRVITAARVQRVVAVAAIEDVVSHPAVQRVVAVAA